VKRRQTVASGYDLQSEKFTVEYHAAFFMFAE